MLHDSETIKTEILKDYEHAVLSMVWCVVNDGQRKLVFSSIEFYPRECTVPVTTEEQNLNLSKKLPARLYYRCITMTARDALDIYLNCLQNHFFTMHWENEPKKDGTAKTVAATTLLCMPAWPYFALSKQNDAELCPFLPEKWGACRMSHLLSTDPDPFLVELLSYEKPVRWIKERLFWDLNDYPELIGSMHMILPNPVFRYMEERLIPNTENGIEKVQIHLAMRANMDVSSEQTLIIAEKTDFGLRNVQFKEVDNDNIMVELAGRAEEFAAAFYCPKRGLLDYTGFGTFMRSICIAVGIKDAERIVNVPGTGEQYTVPLISYDKPIVVGEKEIDIGPEAELGKRIGYRLRKRKTTKAANSAGQKLFNLNSTQDAKDFMRELIKRAKKRVVIVDPYFSTIDFYNYVCAVSSHTVNITILTSALVLKEKSSFISDVQAVNDSSVNGTKCNVDRYEKGEELLQQIATHKTGLTTNGIFVSVMTGDQPLIHDRFLVIDDQVWFSGNSLHNLGERASMIIRLPDATDVLDLINKVLADTERVKTLDAWVGERKKAVAAATETADDTKEN